MVGGFWESWFKKCVSHPLSWRKASGRPCICLLLDIADWYCGFSICLAYLRTNEEYFKRVKGFVYRGWRDLVMVWGVVDNGAPEHPNYSQGKGFGLVNLEASFLDTYRALERV